MKKKKTYNVFIKNLILKAFVGIYPKEQNKKQKLRFNISLLTDDNIRNSNVISDFVSYEEIIKKVKLILDQGHIPLIENLGEKIATECLKDKKILSIDIKIEKLDVFKETESVGIQINRNKKK